MLTDPTLLLLTAVFAPVILGALSLFLPRQAIAPRVLLSLAGPVLAVLSLATYWNAHGLHAQPVSIPFIPSIHFNLDFAADPLGMFFALLVSGIGVLIVLYARGYFGKDADSLFRFFPTLGFFTTAMMGIVLSDNMLSMFLFWELTSVSSFLLIGWDRENPRAVRLAMQAFITTGLGGLALMGGLALLGSVTGAWTFSGLEAAAANGLHGWPANLALAAFILIFAGAAAKSAQFPLHFWLPGAMAAPTPVSAYLHSATMVKAGVYLLARLFPTLNTFEAWAPTLIAFGAVTMLLGAFLAVKSNELKRIFAYTTVSQLGLLTCAYGLGAIAYQHDGHASGNLIWPVTQILNHALYKAPLFILAGAIIHLAGKSNLTDLRNLWRSHRTLALLTLIAGYCLAAGPFTLSFTAKEAFLYQIVHVTELSPSAWLIAAMAVLTAACNVTIFVRMIRVFFAAAPVAEHHRAAHDSHSAHDHHHHESGFWGACIWWPAAFLLIWQFVGGIAPHFFTSLIIPLETHHHYWTEGLPSIIHAFAHPSMPLMLSLGATALGIGLGLVTKPDKVLEDPWNNLYPSFFKSIQLAGYRVFYTLQSGNLRHYVVITLGALLLGVASTTLLDPLKQFIPPIASMGDADFGIRSAAILLSVVICIAAIIIPFVQARIVRVLMLGACGFSVTGMYLIYQAPDLALTQLMFEIISVVLFLLVLRLLPETSAQVPEVPKFPRALFAGAVGLVIGWTVLHAGAFPDRVAPELDAHPVAAASHLEVPEAALLPIASSNGEETDHDTIEPDTSNERKLPAWFMQHAYEGSAQTNYRGGGGHNIVNVILVDFRGYDTLGEITVLSIALMGILAMLAHAPGALSTLHRQSDLTVCTLGAQPHLRSSLFRTSMRLILPLTLIFAGFVFFKGHDEPGGGFIAGLIASVGLAVYRMAEGGSALRRLVPIKPGTTAALGLACALTTAVVPLFLGLPLLTSAHGYIPLPGGGEFHLTSAMFFDLGVFIVVIGVSVGIINRFEEELE